MNRVILSLICISISFGLKAPSEGVFIDKEGNPHYDVTHFEKSDRIEAPRSFVPRTPRSRSPQRMIRDRSSMKFDGVEQVFQDNISPFLSRNELLNLRLTSSYFEQVVGQTFLQPWASCYCRNIIKFAQTFSLSDFFAISPDGSRVASFCGDGDGSIKIFNIQTGKCAFGAPALERQPAFSLKFGLMRSLVFSSDGKRVVSVNSFGVNVWDAFSGQCISQSLEDITELYPISVVSISSDGKKVAFGGLDSERRAVIEILEDIENKATLRVFHKQEGVLLQIAFSQDNNCIFAVFGEKLSDIGRKELKIFDINTGACIQSSLLCAGCNLGQVLSGHNLSQINYKCRPILFSENRELVALAEESCFKFGIFSTRTGHCLATLPGNDLSMHLVAFSCDGKYIATFSYLGQKLGKVSVFHAEEGFHCVGEFPLVCRFGESSIKAIEFWPDGSNLTIVLYDGNIQILSFDRTLDEKLGRMRAKHMSLVPFRAGSQ